MVERLKAIWQRAALVLGSLAITLLLLEVLVRVFMPQHLIVFRPDVYRLDEVTGWHLAPNLDTTINTGERTVRLLTDGDGFRVGLDAGPEQAAYRILAVGDSFVEALQVEHEQMMTTLLAQNLSESLGQKVVVVNDGVGGWDTDQYLLEVSREVTRHDYDLVIVFLYMGNDIIAERPPDHQGAEAYLTRVRYIRHTLRLPRNLTRAELIDALLYPINDFLERRSHLFVLVRNQLQNLRIRLGLSPLFIPPGVLLSAADGPEWSFTADLAADLAAAAARHDVPVLFVLLPANYQVDTALFEEHARLFDIDPALTDLDQPSRLLLTEFTARGLDLVDATPALRAAYAAGQRDLYGRVDVHFAPGGHRVVADFLTPLVLERLSQTP